MYFDAARYDKALKEWRPVLETFGILFCMVDMNLCMTQPGIDPVRELQEYRPETGHQALPVFRHSSFTGIFDKLRRILHPAGTEQ